MPFGTSNMDENVENNGLKEEANSALQFIITIVIDYLSNFDQMTH